MVWRDQDTRSGGHSSPDDDKNNHRNSDHNNETENLLEPVTSPEVESVDGIPLPVLASAEEIEPLIAEKDNSADQNISSNNISRNSKNATPSSSQKNVNADFNTSLASPMVASKTSTRGVPVMVTLDPSDRASLNSGKRF